MKLLGGGSSYEAYLAFDEVTYAPVVVKVVRTGQVTDASSLRGLRREVEALATVNHPVVVRGLRHEPAGDRPHVVLEQVDGPRLSTLLRRYGPLQEQQYLPLAVEVASALHYLRHLGWTHLDIKPRNIIMGAPEQTDPPETGAPGHASDAWGLGVTMFEAVAGYRPFDHGDLDAPDVRQRYPQVWADPRPLPDRVPHEVVKVVGAMLEKRPADRPLPHEVAEALEPVLARLPRARLAGFTTR